MRKTAVFIFCFMVVITGCNKISGEQNQLFPSPTVQHEILSQSTSTDNSIGIAFPSPSVDPNAQLITSYSVSKRDGWFIYVKKTTERTDLNIFHSPDKGQTWYKSTLPIKQPWENEVRKENIFVSLHSKQEAIPSWILLTSSPALGLMEKTVYKSADHGKSWSFIEDLSGIIRNSYITGITFRDEKTGWISGTYHGGAPLPLYHTKDGGKTWNLQKIAIPKEYNYGNPNPPTFDASNNMKGTLLRDFVGESFGQTFEYKTTNGGETWKKYSVSEKIKTG